MSLHCLQTVPDASGGICGPVGPISLPAVDLFACRGDMRSDGVHGSLKTTGMATAPQFQLQRTSRGWVRRKKKNRASSLVASGGREWEGRPGRPGDEDREARQRHCCLCHRFFFFLLLSFHPC